MSDSFYQLDTSAFLLNNVRDLRSQDINFLELWKTEMENNSDLYGEGSGLELLQVSDVLDYLGRQCKFLTIQVKSELDMWGLPYL